MLTFEKLNEFNSVSDAIEWAKGLYPTYPTHPRKPQILHNASTSQARKYAEEMEQWDLLDKEYKELMKQYRTGQAEINTVIESYIREQAGLNSIPEQYRDKIYAKAYENGHSNGFYEVYLELCSLIEIFE